MTESRYKDPMAAAATIERINAMTAKFAALDLSPVKLGELAVLTAHTYISSDRDRAREFFAMLAAEDQEELKASALEALAWTTLFGPNGGPEQRKASKALAWADGYANA